jgi:hypothetical protein
MRYSPPVATITSASTGLRGRMKTCLLTATVRVYAPSQDLRIEPGCQAGLSPLCRARLSRRTVLGDGCEAGDTERSLPADLPTRSRKSQDRAPGRPANCVSTAARPLSGPRAGRSQASRLGCARPDTASLGSSSLDRVGRGSQALRRVRRRARSFVVGVRFWLRHCRSCRVRRGFRDTGRADSVRADQR